MKIPLMIRDAVTHLAPDIPPEPRLNTSDNCHWWYLKPGCEEDVLLLLKMANLGVNLHQPHKDDASLFDTTRMQINLVLTKKLFRELK